MNVFNVAIDQFEGPLDLMLNLIREKQLNLFDLDINVLCDQYITYLHQQEKLHLEIASEYLAELATLIEIKSKSLLPKRTNVNLIEDEDPKEKLIKRLIEYQKFKDISKVLDDYQIERSKQYSKPISLPSIEQDPQLDNKYLQGNANDLMKAMNKCLRHLALNSYRETIFNPKEYLISDICDELCLKYGSCKDKISLFSLIEGCKSLMKVVSIFMAVLDLIHQNKVIFTINKNEEVFLKWSDQYE